MTLYSIALFLHVVGALLLFVTITVEGVALRQLHRALTTESAQGAAVLLRLNRMVGPLSAIGVLIPGLYMTATNWGLVAWIVVALVSWAVIAVLGAVNGIRILALERSQALLTGIRNPDDGEARGHRGRARDPDRRGFRRGAGHRPVEGAPDTG